MEAREGSMVLHGAPWRLHGAPWRPPWRSVEAPWSSVEVSMECPIM